jgi:hypothetical protein
MPGKVITLNPPVSKEPVPAGRVMIAFHREDWGLAPYWAAMQSAMDSFITLVHPLNHQSILGRAAALCLVNLEGTFGASKVYFEPLFDPDEPLGAMGPLAIVAAMSVKDAAVSGLAADAAIAGIQDGRLDGHALGEAMATVLAHEDAPKPVEVDRRRHGEAERLKPSRWPARLTTIARTSALHAVVVRSAIEDTLRPGLPLNSRDAMGFVELLHELCVELGESVTGEDARKCLAVFAADGSGKTASLAKRLLSLQRQQANPRREEAFARAVTARIERAQRWQQWRAEGSTQ